MRRSTISMIGAMVCLALAPLAARAETPSNGCGTGGIVAGTYTEVVDNSGIARTFRVYVPKRYDKNTPAPLITVFHGWGGSQNDFLNNKVVTSQADQRGYILVAPRGLGSGPPDNNFASWTFSGSATGLDGAAGAICDDSITPDYSYQSCSNVKQNTCSWTQCQADDVAFAVALVEYIKDSLCVDSDRVFAAGGSNGGMFTWELGQNPFSAPTFRAIASLIGLPHRGYLDAQGKEDDMPALVITGTLDDVVPPGAWDDPSFTTTSNGDDRYYYTGATAITRSWAEALGCDVSGEAVPFLEHGGRADCRTYCSDDAGWPRVLDCRARMGHAYGLAWSWKLILDFFDKHSQ